MGGNGDGGRGPVVDRLVGDIASELGRRGSFGSYANRVHEYSGPEYVIVQALHEANGLKRDHVAIPNGKWIMLAHPMWVIAVMIGDELFDNVVASNEEMAHDDGVPITGPRDMLLEKPSPRMMAKPGVRSAYIAALDRLRGLMASGGIDRLVVAEVPDLKAGVRGTDTVEPVMRPSSLEALIGEAGETPNGPSSPAGQPSTAAAAGDGDGASAAA